MRESFLTRAPFTMRMLETMAPAPYIGRASVGPYRRQNVEDVDLTQNIPAASAVTPRPDFMGRTGRTDGGDVLLSAILASLEDDKAEEVVTIPLAGKSEMADHMVIATGRSSRQVGAIAEKLADRLKADQGVLVRMEGKDLGDWVLIDAGDVIVHVFRPEVREFYALEKMWAGDIATRPRPAETV